jgi:hypothetical protein
MAIVIVLLAWNVATKNDAGDMNHTKRIEKAETWLDVGCHVATKNGVGDMNHAKHIEKVEM